jgi:hypothetical protein
MRTEKEQRKIIREMDELRYPYETNGFSKRTREVLFGALLVIFFIVPWCHYIDEKNYITVLPIMGWVVFMYPFVMLTPYMRNSYLAKLKYLPLDIRQVKLVRIGYLADLLKKMLLIECVEQTITSIIISAGSNVLKNICVSLLFTIVIGGILPFLVGVIIVWTGKK